MNEVVPLLSKYGMWIIAFGVLYFVMSSIDSNNTDSDNGDHNGDDSDEKE